MQWNASKRTRVTVHIEGGATITSSITKEAAKQAGLETGKPLIALVKYSDVTLVGQATE